MSLLNSIMQGTSDALRDFFSDASMLPLVLLFTAVFIGVLAVPRLVTSRSPVERRLAPTRPIAQLEGAPTLRPGDNTSLWSQLLAGLEKRAIPTNEKERTTARVRLLQAGYGGRNAVRNYFAIRLLLSVLLPVGFLLLAPMFTRNMPVEKVMVITVCLLVAGLYLPSAFVSNRIRNRQRAVQESFPDALDMLMVCVEAGLGLDSAFTRVGAQMASAHPVLAEEFGLVSLELRAGKSREAAMRNFAERIGTTEITSFVVLLIQSDQLGTSVAQTLRVQAEEMRVKRMLRAEEKAHMLPVKLSIPLVLCLLPSMIAVAVLPGIIRIIRDLIPNL
ncbi:MAG TPA: type II secretion system F family protein [Kiloniellales bacterium]